MRHTRNHIDNSEEKTVPTVQRATQSPTQDADDVDRLLQEINLFNLERFLFSTDRKRPTAPFSLLEFTDRDGRVYRIRVGEFGQPGEKAYRIMQAALFQLVQSGRHCEGDVCQFKGRMIFSKRQLARLSGLSWGGADDGDFHRSIMSLHTTRVEMEWYDKASNETKRQSFHPFSFAFFATAGKATERRTIEKHFERCVLDVHELIVDGYNLGYFRAFNLSRLQSLSCKAQMLYKRLFLAFGYLHQKGVKHPRFEKDYAVIATDWLNQRPRRYLSDIIRHIGSDLQELEEVGLLKTQAIEKAKGGGYKLVCTPGPAFYADYPLFLETAAASLPMRAPDLTEEEPFELLAYFHTHCGRTHGQFRPKELSHAEDLLKRFPLEDLKDLVDFALAENSLKAPPQVFGFVAGYLGQWLQVREQRMLRRGWKAKTAACTLCNAAGYLEYVTSDAQRFTQACPHDRAKVERWAHENGHIVASLQVR